MDIKNLEILLVLDDEKHFKRASEKLNISQPALSMKLKSLENEIGVTLVKRGKNFMGLTSEGKVLKNRFSNIVKEYSEIKQLSSELKNSLSGTLRIGVIPTAQLEIANIINFFVQKHKNVNTKVISMPSSKIDEQLHDYKIDIGITYLENEPIKGVIKIPFYDERYFLISSNQNFKTKKTISGSLSRGRGFSPPPSRAPPPSPRALARIAGLDRLKAAWLKCARADNLQPSSDMPPVVVELLTGRPQERPGAAPKRRRAF